MKIVRGLITVIGGVLIVIGAVWLLFGLASVVMFWSGDAVDDSVRLVFVMLLYVTPGAAVLFIGVRLFGR